MLSRATAQLGGPVGAIHVRPYFELAVAAALDKELLGAQSPPARMAIGDFQRRFCATPSQRLALAASLADGAEGHLVLALAAGNRTARLEWKATGSPGVQWRATSSAVTGVACASSLRNHCVRRCASTPLT